MTGLGRNALRIVAADRDQKMDLDDLAMRVAEDRTRGLRALHGDWHCRDHGCRRNRSIAGPGSFLPLAKICGFTWTRRGEARPSSRRGSSIISPESMAPIRLPATPTNGSPCPWVQACFSAGIPMPFAEAFRADTSYMPAKTAATVDDPYITYRSVVAPVYRPEAVPRARRARRSRLSPK